MITIAREPMPNLLKLSSAIASPPPISDEGYGLGCGTATATGGAGLASADWDARFGDYFGLRYDLGLWDDSDDGDAAA